MRVYSDNRSMGSIVFTPCTDGACHIKSRTLKGLFAILLISACAASSVQPFHLSFIHRTGDKFMGIHLRGTVKLPSEKVNDFNLAELSGLAWDDDENVLYAISDTGYLFHLQPIFVKKTLTTVHYRVAYLLKDKNGEKLPSKDSEGLTLLNGQNSIQGDSELVISFERIPRIARFTSTGEWLEDYTLPKPLQQIKNYTYSNAALEAVTIHPKFGVLTAPERPFLGNEGKIVIYALDGRQWTFPQHEAPKSAVVALEALADGSILVLERAYVSKFHPLIISLRRVTLDNCQQPTQKACKTEQIAVFNNSQGWRIDNFEGLTRHQAHFFFIISDNNNDNYLQRTLLSYFEIPSLKEIYQSIKDNPPS